MSKDLDGMVCAFERALLKHMGELTIVKQAIRNKDLAAIVKAAGRALNKSSLPSKLANAAETKSAERSSIFRQTGNELYIKQEYQQAIIFYNKALATAPNNSIELTLAYGNISALTRSIREFIACKMNIDAALALNCPDYLRIKLEERSLAIKNEIGEELMSFALTVDDDMVNFKKFEVERSNVIPCASKDVSVDQWKFPIAVNDISAGSVIAMEKAYVSNTDKKTKYTSCYYCHRVVFFLVPCEGCTKALFCSNDCRLKCYNEFHRIECIMTGCMYIDSADVNQELNKLAVKAAIKMSLKLGWNRLTAASLNMGMERLESSSIKDAFDSNVPTSILCYDDERKVTTNVLINKALFCASVLHLISEVDNYWPEDQRQKEEAMDALSRIILHLNTTFTHRVEITCNSIDAIYPTSLMNGGFQRNAGWFSFASKVPHSCSPNMMAVGFNDSVALVALQRIYEGDRLSMSYVDHYYDMTLPPSPKHTCIRQQTIFHEINYQCECQVCCLEWESCSHDFATLNNKQRLSYNKVKALSGKSFIIQMKVIGQALNDLTGLNNTTQHKDVYKALKHNLNMCQCVCDLNTAVLQFADNYQGGRQNRV